MDIDHIPRRSKCTNPADARRRCLPKRQPVRGLGCDAGAQTVAPARGSPNTCFISADFLTDPLAQARRSVAEAGLTKERGKYAATYHGADARR
jgi:hypothetical protein